MNPEPPVEVLVHADVDLPLFILLGHLFRAVKLQEWLRYTLPRHPSSTVRVARLLLTRSERRGRSGEDGIRLPLALTRQEVAGLIGFTQETA